MRATEQRVKLLGDQFTVGIEFAQKGTGPGETHGGSNPFQIGIGGWQHMGLLVVQVLDAVLHLPQKHIRACQCIGGRLWHQTGDGQLLQGAVGRPGPQFGKLASAHHLQELDRELNLADSAT